MQTIKNNSPAPQGVHTVSGVVYIRPGQSRTVELSEPGKKFAGRLPFLVIDGEKTENAPATETKVTVNDKIDPELENVRAEAKDLGVSYHWKHSVETIQAAIDAKLAE